METFIEAVQSCTPAMRRRLVAVLKGIDTLESCYPVPRRNQTKTSPERRAPQFRLLVHTCKQTVPGDVILSGD